MKPARKAIDPEDYSLSVLSPEDRLDAALKIAREAFKGTKLTMKDLNNAVKSVRRKTYEGQVPGVTSSYATKFIFRCHP